MHLQLPSEQHVLVAPTLPLYTVQYTLFRLQCAVCSVQCPVYSEQCTVCNVQFVVCSVQCAGGSEQCTVYSVQYTVQSAVCSVQCAVHSVQCAVFSSRLLMQILPPLFSSIEYSAGACTLHRPTNSIPYFGLGPLPACLSCILWDVKPLSEKTNPTPNSVFQINQKLW